MAMKKVKRMVGGKLKTVTRKIGGPVNPKRSAAAKKGAIKRKSKSAQTAKKRAKTMSKRKSQGG